MTSYQASTNVPADPARVWEVLVDVAAWPTWDSGVDQVEGTVSPGAKLVIHAAVAAGRAFPVTVSELDPPRAMTFRGGMPLGLFVGTRTFTVTPDATGGADVVVREVYTGLLAPLVTRAIPDLTASFEQFVTGLRQRVAPAG